VPLWLEIVLGLLGWFVLAVLLGLGIGAVIRRADRRQELPRRDPDARNEPPPPADGPAAGDEPPE
jgi:hypothetical protein